MMLLEDIFQGFANVAENAFLMQGEIKKRVDDEIQKNQSGKKNLEKLIEQSPENKDFGKSHHNSTFIDLETGGTKCFGSKQFSYDDRILRAQLSQNRQYQWLLVEIYEAFEVFVRQLYAFLGHSDCNNWPCKDFGNIQIHEIGAKGFEWFVEQSGKKSTSEILNRIRAKYHNVSNVEINNPLKINMKLVLSMLEKFRHLIVHDKGYAKNKEKFVENVFQSAGISKTDKHEKFLLNFFGGNGYEQLIVLLETPAGSKIPGAYHNNFQYVTGFFLSYAWYLTTCIGS